MGATTTPGQEHRATKATWTAEVTWPSYCYPRCCFHLQGQRTLLSELCNGRCEDKDQYWRQTGGHTCRVTQQHAFTKLGGLILLQEREHTHILTLSSWREKIKWNKTKLLFHTTDLLLGIPAMWYPFVGVTCFHFNTQARIETTL